MPKTFNALAGLSGVAEDERPIARRWGRFFEWPMLLIVLMIPVEWYLSEYEGVSYTHSRFSDWAVWGFFLAETLVLGGLVRDKKRYLLGNWMNVVIILSGLPLIWGTTPLSGLLRGFRLLILVGVILRFSHTVKEVLGQNNLGNTLFVACVVVFIAGLLMSGIDPSVESAWEGVWWALVTITTVGYGDVVPSSGAGRVFGSMLIVSGVIIYAVLTANISAFLIKKDHQRKDDRQSEDLRAVLHETRERLEGIERELKALRGEQTDRNKEDKPMGES